MAHRGTGAKPDGDEVEIVVVDYGIGNLKSVRGALERSGARVTISDRRDDFVAADGIVLPGVGAFGTGVDNLEPIRDDLLAGVDAGGPLLGICLGMQLLLSSSEEAPDAEGLGLIEGTNRRFSAEVKVPHMGWNAIRVVNDHPLVAGITEGYTYFVHSYYPSVASNEHVVAETTYDVTFPSIVTNDDNTVFGTQFHPEKSADTGLAILANFVRWCAPA